MDDPLLSAAIGGLMCGMLACSASSTPGSSDGGHESSSLTPPPVTSPDTPMPDTTCDGGVSPDPMVTSTTMVSMTQADFMAQCAAMNGIFEIQPHCGGSNACRGMSYDSETMLLTQHTCRATNQCAGFSCVVCN